MLTSPHLPALSLLTLAISLILCPLANAAMNKGSSSSRLTWGEVTQGQGNVSSATNPASGAFDRQYLDANTSVAGYWSLGAGLEYGNVDDLFDLIDDTSESLTSGDEGGSSGGSSGSDVGYVIDDIDKALLIKSPRRQPEAMGLSPLRRGAAEQADQACSSC